MPEAFSDATSLAGEIKHQQRNPQRRVRAEVAGEFKTSVGASEHSLSVTVVRDERALPLNIRKDFA